MTYSGFEVDTLAGASELSSLKVEERELTLRDRFPGSQDTSFATPRKDAQGMPEGRHA